MSLIAITEVRKRFGANEVLKGIDLDVEPGEVIAIIGKSGSGKSTLLRCINGLETIDEGSIMVAGAQLLPDELHLQGAAPEGRHDLPAVQPVPAPDRGPQRDAGADGGEEGAAGGRRSDGAQDARPRRPAAQVRRLSRKQLSGGQQQRVAIARALAMQPIVLLCDEITSALDPELVNEVLTVVKELAEEGMTLLMVTHEMRFAREVCSRVVFMHQGRVHEIGPPEEVFANPQTPELQQFLGVLH